MTEVTSIIVARRMRPERFQRMLAWSMGAHMLALGFVLFGPMDWRIAADEPPRTVMTISLAGAPGPRETGMTPMAGRAVPTPAPRPAPVAPPPPKPPDNPVAPQRRRPQPQPQQEEQPRTGMTRTETGARGQGFGLATGGAGGAGVQLDVTDFCCPDYIERMVALIQQNWQPNQGVAGTTVVKFTITRPGAIQNVVVERPSGFLALDLAAEQAMLRTRLPELPPQFANPSLTVHVTFQYQR